MEYLSTYRRNMEPQIAIDAPRRILARCNERAKQVAEQSAASARGAGSGPPSYGGGRQTASGFIDADFSD